jgi:hypothetical protein
MWLSSLTMADAQFECRTASRTWSSCTLRKTVVPGRGPTTSFDAACAGCALATASLGAECVGRGSTTTSVDATCAGRKLSSACDATLAVRKLAASDESTGERAELVAPVAV